MSQFVHLHLHTQYSLLDGLNKIPDVLEQAAALGQPAIAMTDHGNLHGAVEFYEAAVGAGIKPIIGCELYVTSGSRHERVLRSQGGAGTYHLTVLAQNLTGYHNLCRLVTRAYKEGFYFKPRVDHELLKEYAEGLIALSGCLQGQFAECVKTENEKAAKQLLEFYRTTFGDRFYLEVQPHQIDPQQNLNSACYHFARDLGIGLVATTDCHYGNKDDHFAQEVLMCISTGKQVTDPDRLRHEGVHLHLKSAAEMNAEFGDWSGKTEAIANSVTIADRCELEFDFSVHYMPQFPSEPGKTLTEMMSELARSGLKERLKIIAEQTPGFGKAEERAYWERLEFELDLISKMGFPGYFLVVADFIVWAKEQGIPVGPGRGSVAGSLAAYAMRITEIDPIANKLLFERFLNPERISLPDIDVDFCINGRDRVIAYVVEKYGAEHVAQIATFGTLKAKAAIKDVGRALGLSYAETDRVAQLVPAPRQGFDYPLAEALKMEPRLREYAKAEGKELLELSMKLEGLTRHSSTHAAGVVIGDRPLIDMLPLMVDKDGNDVTQYTMNFVEKIGLVKFDFLGLKTLTVIHTALRLVEESRKIKIDLDTLPLDDARTYSLLCAGNTTGVFQLESSGITEMTMRLKPNCFDDLLAIVALYRPGPLDAGMVDHYIERKHGREPVSYLHPSMKETLADTYGILLYQEQIMQLAQRLAGYTLSEADILRKAMGKKIPEEMAKQKDRFVSGAVSNGIDKKAALEIFSQMETFARYGFNRSHSAAYALVSYQTAYLKAHFGVEFMAALMSLEMGDSDKTIKNLNECRQQQISVLPPDVNESSGGFSARSGALRYGLEAVKGVGEKAVIAVIEERDQNGPYEDIEDFVVRVDLHSVNKRVVENLIKCGAFDFSGVPRRDMFERLDELVRAGQSAQRERDSNQISLFGGEGNEPISLPRRAEHLPEWPVNQKLAFEREALGTYISGHPLEKFRRDLVRLGVISTEQLKERAGESEVRVGGVVAALRLKNTRRGDRYATFQLEDWQGQVEAIVWPDVYREYANLLVADEPIVATGKPDITEERSNFIINKIESLIAIRDRNATHGLLILRESDGFEEHLDELLEVFRRYTGSCPVKVRLMLDEGAVSIVLKDRSEAPVCVMPSEALCDEVEEIFGEPVLSFV